MLQSQHRAGIGVAMCGKVLSCWHPAPCALHHPLPLCMPMNEAPSLPSRKDCHTEEVTLLQSGASAHANRLRERKPKD